MAFAGQCYAADHNHDTDTHAESKTMSCCDDCGDGCADKSSKDCDGCDSKQGCEDCQCTEDKHCGGEDGTCCKDAKSSCDDCDSCKECKDCESCGDCDSSKSCEDCESCDSCDDSAKTVQSILDERANKSRANLPAEMLQTFADGDAAIRASGVTEAALKPGSQAPDFTLPDALGNPVSLSELLADGPVVLTWYRGGWCPYCNLYLNALQERIAEFEATGATLVAISPEINSKAMLTVEASDITFPVLSDQGNTVAEAYGIVFSLPENLHALYESRLKLSEYNGDQEGKLPLSATYVIDRDGTIVWAFLDVDYTKRAEPADVVFAIEQLTQDNVDS